MAAQQGTLEITGKSGRKYSVDVYLPDAVATNQGFNMTGLAGSTSNTQLVVPEDGAITGFIVQTTAPTAVGAVFTLNSATVIGGTIRFGNCLSTLATRTTPMIGVRQGDILQALQY